MKNIRTVICQSEIYSCARELRRVSTRLARTDKRAVNSGLEQYSLRTLAHCAATTDASSGLGTRSVRYAKLSALKLAAFVDAADGDGQNSVAKAAFELLTRLMEQLDQALGQGAPSATRAKEDPVESASEPAPREGSAPSKEARTDATSAPSWSVPTDCLEAEELATIEAAGSG